MSTYCFKTNVYSEQYLEQILPHLLEHKDVEKCEVRDQDGQHLLFVDTSLSEETVAMIIKSAGFNADAVR